MNATRVSVILCFLNEQRFLAEAVESVLAQRFADWELILVDDGSADGSSAIAKGYAARSEGRVVYVEHEGHRNVGLSASRNVGIRHARGELICFIDADDVWYPMKLACQVDLMDEHPQVGMVIGASNYWRSWSDEPGAQDCVIPVGVAPDRVVMPPELMHCLYPLGSGAAPPPSDLMVRHHVLREVGGFEASFHGPLMLYEDQAFLSKIYRRYPVYVSGECWDCYRVRPGSIVSSTCAAGQYWAVRLHFLTWLRADLRRRPALRGDHVPLLRDAMREARRQLVLLGVRRVLRRVMPWPAMQRLRQSLHGWM